MRLGVFPSLLSLPLYAKNRVVNLLILEKEDKTARIEDVNQ